MLDHAARYCEPLKAAIDAGRRPKIDWLDYDWRLNRKENAG